MQLDAIRTIVAIWAASEPLIRTAWIFGSRVRGTQRSNSDVDVAVEVDKLSGDSDPWATFMFEKDRLKETLQIDLPFQIDLQWYGGPVETPIIHAALERSSVLVYQAD